VTRFVGMSAVLRRRMLLRIRTIHSPDKP
jgi:hypothetical protein